MWSRMIRILLLALAVYLPLLAQAKEAGPVDPIVENDLHVSRSTTSQQTHRDNEESKPVDKVDSAISLMLLGAIGFQISIFYLVNWPDDDIKRESWKVISSCISIFVAVLLFQGFNQLIEEYVIGEGENEMWEVFIDVSQLLFWLSCMQLTLAITSGAIHELWNGQPPPMETIEINVSSLAKLLSHVTGFSSINAFGSIQQTFLGDDPVTAFMIVPAGFFGLFTLYHFYDIVRDYISRADDNEIDEYEAKWDEETEEAENDVAGLSLAFLTVQGIRFSISGILPNEEGIEPPELAGTHEPNQWLRLWMCGIVSGILGILAVRHHAFLHHPSERMERVVKIFRNYFTFGSAWCSFYAAKWAFTHTSLGQQESMLHVLLALTVSAVVFVSIFLMDKVMDHKLLGEGEDAEEALEEIILALSVLVGFSWEQSFDTAVSVLADDFASEAPKAVSKLAMSLILVAVVFPAWRFFILPKELELIGEMENHNLKRLKEHALLHYQLMVGSETDEHSLDKAHLNMKRERRQCHGHGQDLAPPDRLIHVQVTGKGIKQMGHHPHGTHEVAQKKRTRHLSRSSTVNLLD